jgi:hypothetical protein
MRAVSINRDRIPRPDLALAVPSERQRVFWFASAQLTCTVVDRRLAQTEANAYSQSRIFLSANS